MIYDEIDILNAHPRRGKRFVSFRALANQFSNYVNSASGMKSAVFFSPISRFKRTFNYYTHPSAALSRGADVPTYTLSSSYIIQSSHVHYNTHIVVDGHAKFSGHGVFIKNTTSLPLCAVSVCARIRVPVHIFVRRSVKRRKKTTKFTTGNRFFFFSETTTFRECVCVCVSERSNTKKNIYIITTAVYLYI